MTTLKDIIATLPKLSGEEQDQIVQAIKATQAMGGSGKKGTLARADIDPDALLVISAITTDMKNYGRDNTSIDMAAQTAPFRAFAVKCKPVMEFMREAMPTLNKRRALLQVACRLLRTDLEDMGQAPTTRSMMAHVHRLPSMIQRAFPGYYENGMLHLVIRDTKEKENG